MIQGCAADGLGGVEVVCGGFGGDHHLLQGQRIQGQFHGETFYITADVQFFLAGDISQAGNLQLIGAVLYAAQGKRAVFSGNGPEVVLVQTDHGPCHGVFATSFYHFARHPGRSGQGREGQGDQ